MFGHWEARSRLLLLSPITLLDDRYRPVYEARFAPDESPLDVRWWAIATVTPSTNVTGLNLPYRAYLDAVFHRTRLARLGHAVCLPVIVTALLAALGPIHLALIGAGSMMCQGGSAAVRTT